MQPFPGYCVLHALMAQQMGENDPDLVFVCPAGLSKEEILEVEQATRIN